MNKTLTKTLSFLLTGLCLISNAKLHIIEPIYAEGEITKEGTGKVTVSVIYETNYQYPLTVELFPKFDGEEYCYELTPKNPIVTDYIAVGQYSPIAYLTNDEDVDAAEQGSMKIFTLGDIVVTETPTSSSSTAIVVASEYYSSKYAYDLAFYRDTDGNPLSGNIKSDDAEKLIEQLKNDREATRLENGGANGAQGIDTNDIPYDAPATSVESAKPDEIPANEEEEKEEEKADSSYVKFIAPGAIAMGCIIALLIYKKRR